MRQAECFCALGRGLNDLPRQIICLGASLERDSFAFESSSYTGHPVYYEGLRSEILESIWKTKPKA
jgi:hypothetical protein